MLYVTIDGDDIGQKITSYYLSNDVESLKNFNDLMGTTTRAIADYLKDIGFTIVFCAADGVAGHIECDIDINESIMFDDIAKISLNCATFSIGVGASLRESYIALMSAKSNGKSCLHNYANLIG